MIGRILSEIIIPSVTGIKLRIPDPGGLFGGGLLSGVGTILQLVFGLTVVVWIGLSLLAGFKIIQSQGNPDKIQEGITRIKYAWISVTVFFGVFVLITIIGVFVGYKSPLEWGNTLAQCGGFDGPFYFAQVDQQTAYYSTYFDTKVGSGQKGYCCVYAAIDNRQTGKDKNPLTKVSDLGINNDGYNWYLPLAGSKEADTKVNTKGEVEYKGDTNTGFTQCVELGK